MSTNLMCADLISIDDDTLAQWLLFLEVFNLLSHMTLTLDFFNTLFYEDVNRCN